jgi:hypothetical protein
MLKVFQMKMSSIRLASHLARPLAVAFLSLTCSCAGPGSGNKGGSGGNSGGTSGSGGSSTTGGVGGSNGSGGLPGSGGVISNGGSGQPDASISSGGAGGTTNTGGSTAKGGTAGKGGAGGGGGVAGSGGSAGSGGTAGTSSTMTGTGGASLQYELPPPSQCHDQDYIPYDYNTKTGCISGDKTTDCGGKCQVINACSETTSEKPNADVTFMCQRNLLFSPEMEQAATDDGNTGFHYAVVGHDADKGGIDGQAQSPCCQCYQLVYAYPSPYNDRQAQLNPDNPNPPASAIPIPPPLIVQAFNTAATNETFDVYMPAGGLGANNACAKLSNTSSRSGQYMYTSYPEDGQPSSGGVNLQVA